MNREIAGMLEELKRASKKHKSGLTNGVMQTITKARKEYAETSGFLSLLVE